MRDFRPKLNPASDKTFYLENKDRIDSLIGSISWVMEDPKSSHGYYTGFDKLGNKYRRFPNGDQYSVDLANSDIREIDDSPKEALIRAMEAKARKEA